MLVSLMQKQETALLKTRVDTLQQVVRVASSGRDHADN
jgi:hypothetical protein